MKARRLLITPQAGRDFKTIVAWYKEELGAKAAAKVGRTLQAGIRACTRVQLSRASRPDLPEGYFRVVAKTHIIVFTVGDDIERVVRILHGARDIAAIIEQENN